MSTAVDSIEMSTSLTTSLAGFAAYPITAMPSFATINYAVFEGLDSMFCKLFQRDDQIFHETENEFDYNKIIVSNAEYIRFKEYVESMEIVDNPNLKKLMMKFSK